MATNIGGFSYTLEDYIDERTNSPVNSLNYEDAAFTHCGVYYIELTQFAFSTPQDQVRSNIYTTESIEAYGVL